MHDGKWRAEGGGQKTTGPVWGGVLCKCYTTQGPNVKKRGERRFDEPVVSLRGDVAEKKRASKKGQIKDSWLARGLMSHCFPTGPYVAGRTHSSRAWNVPRKVRISPEWLGVPPAADSLLRTLMFIIKWHYVQNYEAFEWTIQGPVSFNGLIMGGTRDLVMGKTLASANVSTFVH